LETSAASHVIILQLLDNVADTIETTLTDPAFSAIIWAKTGMEGSLSRTI
jgi:hypothetical protein